MAIVDQLKRNGVGSVRTSLRPDDKSMALAKALQSAGIGLVLNIGWKTEANAPERPEYPKPHIRAALPLSRIDPGLSKDYFQSVFDKLDAYGVTLAGVELGNEINWVDFNGDFPMPGRERPSRSASSPKTRSANRSPQASSNTCRSSPSSRRRALIPS